MASEHTWLPILSAIMSTTLAAMALWVASRQSKTNMAKLRLDLYDKRFAIYETALAFYQELAGSPDALESEAFKALHRGFTKAHRETQFLFDDDSGVFELMGRISVDSYKIIATKKHARELRGDVAVKMVAEANDVYAKIEKAMNDLERAIGPYIRFNKALI
ncbi:MAG TPA: hypothetical protein VHJ20_04635 [Polyangia bacterium]|nr:hypothetical protein [Polyangia bacterium]